MNGLALGFKSHSGWAAWVVLDDSLSVMELRRVGLAQPEHRSCAKQPYHAAERLEASAARQLIERGIDAARCMALSEMRATSGAAHKMLTFGKSLGPPWEQDQSSAALALSVLLSKYALQVGELIRLASRLVLAPTQNAREAQRDARFVARRLGDSLIS